MTVVAERTETAAPVELAVNRNGGVTGLTVVVAVRDAQTANSWLDFNDDTFKTVGWTTRQASVAEVSAANAPGVYALAGGLDISAITNLPAATNNLILEFAVSGPGPDANLSEQLQLVESFLDVGADVADDVWDEDIAAAHGTADTSGLLLRALGRLISQRSNNANLHDLLGVPDSAGADVPSQTTDEVWDESAAAHTSGGSMGALQNNVDVAVSTRAAPGDAMALTAGAVDDVWDEPAVGHNAAGTVGEQQNRIDQALSTTESNIRGADSRDLSELAGAGWSGATDTLEAIRNAIDTVSNVTRVRCDVPDLVRPEVGSISYVVTVLFEDTNGNPEDPDSNTVTVAAEDETGGSLTVNLSSTTMTRIQIGVYTVSYTVASAHQDGQVRLLFSYSEATVPFLKIASRTIVDAGSLTPTVQEIVDGVWDEPQASHVAAGSMGESMNNAGGTASVTPGAIADAVWEETLADHSGTSGSTAEQLARIG